MGKSSGCSGLPSSLHWRDYDFERSRIRLSDGFLDLTADQRDVLLRQYRRAVARSGRAPRMGDPIFPHESIKTKTGGISNVY